MFDNIQQQSKHRSSCLGVDFSRADVHRLDKFREVVLLSELFETTCVAEVVLCDEREDNVEGASLVIGCKRPFEGFDGRQRTIVAILHSALDYRDPADSLFQYQ